VEHCGFEPAGWDCGAGGAHFDGAAVHVGDPCHVAGDVYVGLGYVPDKDGVFCLVLHDELHDGVAVVADSAVVGVEAGREEGVELCEIGC